MPTQRQRQAVVAEAPIPVCRPEVLRHHAESVPFIIQRWCGVEAFQNCRCSIPTGHTGLVVEKPTYFKISGPSWVLVFVNKPSLLDNNKQVTFDKPGRTVSKKEA